ncbi:hypothetical protein ACN2C6_13530 [Caulobacter sp. ErkDOM-YI]|uniref:hypothetical protein n=1 Tax=unclassified Caulobacter TaxID=2648921 RepID=UPI003AF809F1
MKLGALALMIVAVSLIGCSDPAETSDKRDAHQAKQLDKGHPKVSSCDAGMINVMIQVCVLHFVGLESNDAEALSMAKWRASAFAKDVNERCGYVGELSDFIDVGTTQRSTEAERIRSGSWLAYHAVRLAPRGNGSLTLADLGTACHTAARHEFDRRFPPVEVLTTTGTVSVPALEAPAGGEAVPATGPASAPAAEAPAEDEAVPATTDPVDSQVSP